MRETPQEGSSLQYRSGDAQLFYTEQGAGAPLILLHPTPLHHGFWLPVAALLAARYRVVMPDLRGHGQSEAGDGPITIEKLGADIERLLDELCIERAIFAGCSIGGYTLYELWRRCPRRVRALAFCSSKPQADTEQNRATRQANMEKIRQRGSGEFIEAMLGSLIGSSTRSRWPQKTAEAREMMQAMRPEAILAVQQGLASRPDSVETAKTIQVPCCVVAAGEDGGSTPADMRLLAEAIRSGGAQVEYHEIPDAGHYAPWEQPETAGPILRRFFDGVRP
jgi:3-oxoadipate enol-lactonase